VDKRRPRKKVAVLVNIVAPYRLPIYRGLAARFHTTVFHGGREGNRGTWEAPKESRDGLHFREAGGFTIPYGVGKGGVYDLKYLHLPVALPIRLLTYRPNAIITTEMGARTLLALAYGGLFGVPVWVWWGGTLRTERSVGTGRRLLRGMIARWARRWISYGETSTEYLVQSLGVPRTRILQIQNCVDETLFEGASDDRREPNRPPLFLYVGQMIGRKGVDRLIAAAAAARRGGATFGLRLVGDGPDRAALERMARDQGLDAEFLAGQPPAAMPALYRAADLLVFPTLEDVWGLVVNEALWAGLPVIGSIHAGCATELLPPEYRFDPEDHEGFATLLTAAARDRLPAPDRTGLRRSGQVARSIADAVEAVVGGASSGGAG
jgi:glycosyltransferase involved in cell wall biosynthesis